MCKIILSENLLGVQPWTPLEVILNGFCFRNYTVLHMLYATVAKVGVAKRSSYLLWNGIKKFFFF